MLGETDEKLCREVNTRDRSQDKDTDTGQMTLTSKVNHSTNAGQTTRASLNWRRTVRIAVNFVSGQKAGGGIAKSAGEGLVVRVALCTIVAMCYTLPNLTSVGSPVGAAPQD